MTHFNAQQFEVYPDGIGEHFWMYARHQIVFRELMRLGDRGGRILDVGCGRGISTLFLRQRGLDVAGCDTGRPEPYAAEITQHIHYQTSAFDLPAGERENMSTILLLDVIEHIENREDWLRRLAASFPNLRTVVLTVPARNELWSNYDDYYGHFIRFDVPSMRELARKVSFDVRKLTYFFHALYAPMWLTARLRGARNLRPGPPHSALSRGLHAVIAGFFAIEEQIVPGAVPGGSMLAIFERR